MQKPQAPDLALGRTRPLLTRRAAPASTPYRMPANHLVTHGVIVGMTGSGKTGLVMVTVEEALRASVPVVMIDVKGDLPNLLLAFPDFDPASMRPFIEGAMDANDPRDADECARDAAEARRAALEEDGIDEAALRSFRDGVSIRVLTPGASHGEPVHLFSGLERLAARWAEDPEAALASLSAAISLVLRLLGRESDPAKSKEHVLLSVLANARLERGEGVDLSALLGDLREPPIERVGELPLDEFLSVRERKALASSLNSLIASPMFHRWRTGVSLDAREWLAPRDGKTSATIVSVAHLDDDERSLVLGLVLEELLSHVRSMPGSARLAALIVFDEVYGFLPPHPQNPPTKRPLVALMKQARAFGVGVVIATQNPMDLDYRALGNAGVWCIGRLQTDADRERVVDGLASAMSVGEERPGVGRGEIGGMIKKLRSRWFVIRDAHAGDGLGLLWVRCAMSWMRGPMTRGEVGRVCRGLRAADEGAGRACAIENVVSH